MGAAHSKTKAQPKDGHKGAFTLEDLTEALNKVKSLDPEDITVPRLMKRTGKKESRVRRYLDDMVEKGWLVREWRSDETGHPVMAYLPVE